MWWLAWTVAAEGRELTLTEAVARGREGNASVRVAAWDEESARAGVVQARGAWDPVLSASGSGSTSESAGFLAGFATSSTSTSADAALGVKGAAPTGTTWSVEGTLERSTSTNVSNLGAGETEQQVATWASGVSLTLSQDLLAPLRRSTDAIAARTAGERLVSAGIARSQAEIDGTLAVAEAWWAWWSATDAARVADGSVALAVALVDTTRARRDEGQIEQVELDRAVADRLDAQRAALRAHADVRRTADGLLVAIGERPGQDITPAGPGTLPLELERDPAAALARARDANLALAAVRADLTAAEAALGDARDLSLPTLNLTGSLGISSLTETAADAVRALTRDDGLPRASAALDLSVPLGGHRARGGRADARAAVEIARVQLAAREASVEADVRAGLDAVDTARHGLALAEARLAVAQSTEAGEQARVDEGSRRLDQLLDARAAREQAEADLRGAIVEVGRTELELAALLGGGS